MVVKFYKFIIIFKITFQYLFNVIKETYYTSLNVIVVNQHEVPSFVSMVSEDL